MAYTSKTLEPLNGITLPVGNTTEEIQDSICSIIDYLDRHLPIIIKNVIQTDPGILKNTTAFSREFKATFDQSGCQNKSSNLTSVYAMKETGLRIIHFAIQWMKSF